MELVAAQKKDLQCIDGKEWSKSVVTRVGVPFPGCRDLHG